MSTLVQAMRMALHVGESRLGVTDIFGEDVGAPLGGVFTATQGLKTAWNSPLDERGVVGAAIGLALAGQKPVAEIQFCDYAFNTIDLLKLAGGMLWSSNGQWGCPMVLMTPVGSGIHGSIYHSHSFDAQATRIPGWKIVMPSTPRDAYGLMLSAIADPNPVMFLAPKALMRTKSTPGEEVPGEPDEKTLSKMIDAPLGDRTKWEPQWPALPDLFIPIGQAKTVRRGRDVTIVAYGRMVAVCTKAAAELGGRRDRGRGHRSPLDLPLRLGLPQGEHPPDQPGRLRERGHRSDELRRAPDPAHGGRALLRAACAAEAPRWSERPWDRARGQSGGGERAAARRDREHVARGRAAPALKAPRPGSRGEKAATARIRAKAGP